LVAAAGINDPGYSVSAMSKRAAIALGSNLGDRLANLQGARDRIRALEGAREPIVQSAVYETSPVDCEPGAQNFYNAVIEIGFEKSADALLAALQQIERALGRERMTPSPQSSPQPTPVPSLPLSRASLPAGEKGRGGHRPRVPGESGREAVREAPGEGNLSRTIDLDLLYFGSEQRAEAALQLPHPQMTQRKFVLQPLCDIAPDLRLPGQTKNVGELLAQLQDQGKITRLRENW
jgi:2-amino-4-hydroxy-6-hydroxymethyldihydropteridine diphosphokinase